MKLSEIKEGAGVFIDANIFIYHFTGVSQECKEFLRECLQKKFIAYTSLNILAEVCHRLMAIEAVSLGMVKPKNPSISLQKNSEIVKKLSVYYTQITNIMSWDIKIISTPDNIFIKSQNYRQRFGLLTNDSFIPVYMEQSGINHLASADKLFKSIPHISLYSPTDIYF